MLESWPWPPTRNGCDDFRHPWTDTELKVMADLLPAVNGLWEALKSAGTDDEPGYQEAP